MGGTNLDRKLYSGMKTRISRWRLPQDRVRPG